jgi:hypothetical protein
MISIPEELIVEGVSRAFSRLLESKPDLGEKLLLRMAELKAELLTPAEAAEMLGITKETLRENYRSYGLEKSTALGPNEPRYFRSQVIEALKRDGKVIHAHRRSDEPPPQPPAITRNHKRQAPTLRAVA